MGSLQSSWLFPILMILSFSFFDDSCAQGKCLNDQRALLLQLNHSLLSDFSFHDTDFHHSSTFLSKRSTWDLNTDCCSYWHGITCDSDGHVIGLDLSSDGIISGLNDSSSLFNLRYLERLNLAGNYFSGTPIASGLDRLTSLNYLNLSSSGFRGQIPIDISHMTKFCWLHGRFPKKILQLQTLRSLDLSDNYLQGSLPEFPLNGLLQELVLRRTNFAGELPYSIGNLRFLSKLDFYHCDFNGSLPASISKLNQLQYLDLSYNSFTAQLTEFFNGSKLNQLQYLDLSHNSFTGQLGNFSIGSSSQLRYLDLSNNQLQGRVPVSIFEFSELNTLRLGSNNFSNSNILDVHFHKWRNLNYLDLSNIRLSINATNANFALFPQMETLFLRSCNLREFPTFLENQSQMFTLDLSSNQIRGKIPNWMWKIGNNPNWFQYGLSNLNVSNNFLEDSDRPLFLTSIVIDFHYNMLQGKNPISTPYADYLDYSFKNFTSMISYNSFNVSDAFFFSISNNQISGEIPTSICEGNPDNYEGIQIAYLDLSNNNFSGQIPHCLLSGIPKSEVYLKVLNLRGNNLQGIIPDTFPKSCELEKFDLNGNKLEGNLPRSLSNCTALKVLDVGNNRLTGNFPEQLGNMPRLRVLVLRPNKLYGPWGSKEKECNFPMLQIIDVSFNNFSGIISKECFSSWNGMMVNKTVANKDHGDGVLVFGNAYDDKQIYQEIVTITLKGVHMEVGKILDNFTTMDFSNNQFEGEIPESIGNLTLLYALNLSRNSLTGSLLSNIGNLTHLESLDLSQNKLIGEIPFQLASLSSLEVINLSYNKSGSQFQTFDSSAFEGNDGLCGFPLTKNCTSIRESPTNFLGSKEEFDWVLFAVTFLGFVVGASMVIGPQYFWKRGREWVNERINKILNIA
ncbi:hypothetical protein MKX01_001779 [Papaver californicum]|nr:hypothetical protein MKX01_001779 [Papaver californicum]